MGFLARARTDWEGHPTKAIAERFDKLFSATITKSRTFFLAISYHYDQIVREHTLPSLARSSAAYWD